MKTWHFETIAVSYERHLITVTLCIIAWQLAFSFQLLEHRFPAYLGEPEEILHEGAAVGIIHLHDGDLVLSRHQQTVFVIEHSSQVDPPEGQQEWYDPGWF